MKKYLILLIFVSFLAGCGSGGGGSSPAGDGNDNGNTGGSKVTISCSGTGKVARIKVDKDGIYRITYSDLYKSCSSVSFSPSTISLSNEGIEIPIEVVDSNINSKFDSGDYIEFYGKAIGRDDSRFRYSETNVYWLSVGEKTGKRMAKITPSAGQSASSYASFSRKLHVEEDTWYVQENYPELSSSTDMREREHWFWGGKIHPENPEDDIEDKISHDFSTRYIDKTVPVSLKIRLQSVRFEHYVKVYINANPNPIWNDVWESQEPYDIEISDIPATYFNNGPNTLTIESAGGGLFYLDWFEVIYNREYKAEHNVIEFTGNNSINISNFSSNDISVYEITDPVNVQRILISEPEEISTGNYEVSFSGLYGSQRQYLSLASGNKLQPVIEPYSNPGIKSKSADYIIITHEDFIDSIKPLADYRAQLGYKVLTVNVRDIYDEFGDGVETPHAIKAFLTHAYKNWATKPAYVLLAGDATVDYKDVSGNGEKYGVRSYVPAYLYNYPGFEREVPSDNWFADVDGLKNDGSLPEMAIGRIPAKSSADVTAVVKKIISHESSVVKSNSIMLIADTAKNGNGPPSPDNEQTFEMLSDSIVGLLPSGYMPYELNRRTYQGDLKSGIISAINDGQLIVNYAGHGTVTDWTNDYIFTSGDVAGLNNNKYPFLVALNCMNGYFIHGNEGGKSEKDVDGDGDVDDNDIQYGSISESFLTANGKGALAVWSSSTLGFPSEHDPLAQALYNLILNENVTVLGDAVTKAKERAYYENNIQDDVVQTFIFFGDPATRLK